jgi:hypothetical protein
MVINQSRVDEINENEICRSSVCPVRCLSTSINYRIAESPRSRGGSRVYNEIKFKLNIVSPDTHGVEAHTSPSEAGAAVRPVECA